MPIRSVVLCVAVCASLSALALREARAQTGTASPEPAKPAVERGQVGQPGRVAGDASKKGSPSKVDALTIKQGAASGSTEGQVRGSSLGAGSRPRNVDASKKGDGAASDKRSNFELQKSNDDLKRLTDPGTSTPVGSSVQPARGADTAKKGSPSKGAAPGGEVRSLPGKQKPPPN